MSSTRAPQLIPEFFARAVFFVLDFGSDAAAVCEGKGGCFVFDWSQRWPALYRYTPLFSVGIIILTGLAARWAARRCQFTFPVSLFLFWWALVAAIPTPLLLGRYGFGRGRFYYLPTLPLAALWVVCCWALFLAWREERAARVKNRECREYNK